jgi:hypothetical protein
VELASFDLGKRNGDTTNKRRNSRVKSDQRLLLEYWRRYTKSEINGLTLRPSTFALRLLASYGARPYDGRCIAMLLSRQRCSRINQLEPRGCAALSPMWFSEIVCWIDHHSGPSSPTSHTRWQKNYAISREGYASQMRMGERFEPTLVVISTYWSEYWCSAGSDSHFDASCKFKQKLFMVLVAYKFQSNRQTV